MQRISPAPPDRAKNPTVLIFERNETIAVPLLAHLRSTGYDVRAARIPVEVFDILQRETVSLLLIDLGNAAANRREFWVGLDGFRRKGSMQVLTFRYLSTGETGQLEEGLHIARADVEIVTAHDFSPVIDAVRARLPDVTPIPKWHGAPSALPVPRPAQSISMPPQNMAPPSQSPSSRTGMREGWTPLDIPASSKDLFNDDASGDSPFAAPYQENPFKRKQPPAMNQPPSNGTVAHQPWENQPPKPAIPPGNGHLPRRTVDGFAAAFSPFNRDKTPDPAQKPIGMNHAPRLVQAKQVEDTWQPPEPSARKGIAYRGFNDEPLAPDDPRLESETSEVPVVLDAMHNSSPARNDRALSTVLMDSAVLAPQRIDALRSIQQTLNAIGMEFSISELAMLFRFLTPDQLMAALLVSRNRVTPEEIASLGRIKQELMAAGKDYDLATLLVMFNVMEETEVRAIQEELAG